MITLSKELRSALAQIFWHLRHDPIYRRQLGWEHLWIKAGRKYIMVIHFGEPIFVLLPNGDAYEGRFRGSWGPNYERPLGNLIRIVKRKTWRKTTRMVACDGHPTIAETVTFGRAPRVPTCTRPGCDRTNKVQDTVLGLRCANCQAIDLRHIRSIRQLGGTPRANGRVLLNDSAYYRT